MTQGFKSHFLWHRKLDVRMFSESHPAEHVFQMKQRKAEEQNQTMWRPHKVIVGVPSPAGKTS
jgi:hypothetical protein